MSEKKTGDNEEVIEMKRNFYSKYLPIFRKNERTSSLITNQKYSEIVETLLHYNDTPPAERTAEARRYVSKYRLQNNVHTATLVRNWHGVWMRVPTYEQIFNIIHRIHKTKLHPKCREQNKKNINKEYYGVPRCAISLYLSMCPNCIANRKTLHKKKQNKLKMILMSNVGQRSQVDLIDMTSQPDPSTGDKWIMRYADHLSGYAFVRCMPTKESKNTGTALVQILSQSVVPQILQSDNGSEFLGR